MARPGSPDFLREIGMRLATARTRAGLSQADAAKKLGMARPQTLGDREAGKGAFSIEALAEMCELYGVSSDFVLGLSQTPTMRAGVAVINLALERAVRDARSIEAIESEARRLLAETVEHGIVIGYSVPQEYEVVPEEEYGHRVRAVRAKIDRLQPKRRKIVARLLGLFSRRVGKGGAHGEPRSK